MYHRSRFKTFDAFRKKAALISSTQACQGSTLVAKQLPMFESIQSCLRKLVSKEYQEIEDKIDTSTDWDMIERRIKAFGCAGVLDKFLDEEVNQRL
jgi:hypothetical protein